MSFEEQFDKIINNKINESAFPFDEKNWEKASALINANRLAPIANNKRKYLLLFSLALLTVSTVGVFTYVQLNNNTVVATNTPNNKITTATTKNLNPLTDNNNNSNSNNNNNTTTPIYTNEENLNTKNDTKNLNNTTNSKKSAEDNVVKQNTNINNNNNTPNNQTNTINEETTNTNPTNKVDEKDATLLAVNKPKENTAITTNKLIAKKSSNINTAIKTSNMSKTTNKLFQKNNVAVSGKINPIITKTQNNTAASNVMNDAAETTNGEEKERIKPTFEPLTTKILNIEQSLNDGECKNTSVNFLQAYDNDYFKNTKPKFNYLNLEAGATYLLGFNTTSTKDAVGTNFYAGINYGIYISKKISVSAGLQFYNVGNIKQSFYTASQTVYGFGSTGSYTNITTNSLYYISIPLKLNYVLSPISKIGIGLNTGFLVGGKNTIETYNLFDGVKANVTTTTNNGYYEGVNTKNMVLSAFYTHKLNKRLSINGELMYGISDIYNNTTTNTTKQNTIGLKLGLTFTLFDK